MLFNPTIPGRYNVPSMALDNLSVLSKLFMCSDVNVGLRTYFISSNDESSNYKYWINRKRKTKKLIESN